MIFILYTKNALLTRRKVENTKNNNTTNTPLQVVSIPSRPMNVFIKRIIRFFDITLAHHISAQTMVTFYKV